MQRGKNVDFYRNNTPGLDSEYERRSVHFAQCISVSVFFLFLLAITHPVIELQTRTMSPCPNETRTRT